MTKNAKVKQEGSHAPDATEEKDKEIPSPEEVQLTLRVQVDSCSPADLSALTTILLGGTQVVCRNHLLWIQAVKDHFDDVPLFVSNCRLLQLVCKAASHVGSEVCLMDSGGCQQTYDIATLCSGSSPFPDYGVHVSIRANNVLSGLSTADDPQLVNIDCTGLGGHDLGGFKDYDICIRTDKHGQSNYLGHAYWSLLVKMVNYMSLWWLLGAAKRCMSFWSYIIWPVLKHGTPSWTYMPASMHMGTCWIAAGACPTHV